MRAAQKTDWIFFAALRRRELCETFYKLTSLRILRRLVQYQAGLGEAKPRQVARYKCFAEGKTLAGLHIAAIEAVICSGNRFSLTQQSTGLLLPASTPLRVCEVRSSFRFPPQALLQKIRDATLPADKTVKFKFLGTGMISVMPVPLLAARPRGCSLQDRTRYVPSACACRWTCQVLLHRPP